MITIMDKITASKPKFYVYDEEYEEIVNCKHMDPEKWTPETQLSKGMHEIVPNLLGMYDGVLIIRTVR